MHQAQPTLHPPDLVRRGRRRPRAGGLGAFVAAIAVLAIAGGCASGGGGGSGGANVAASGAKCGYGCMVPGPRVAAALRISAIDTVPELNPRTTLRPTVDNAIRQHITQYNWTTSSNCFRRFGGPEVFVVVFHRYCDPAMGPDSDPRMVVGFSATGQVLGEVTWTGANTVSLLMPERRH